MSTTVPAILKYLTANNNINIMEDQDYSSPVRAKKRRLDHLSWEQKLQRKKLKNRVAAQTSRDRKKAKMEQMESVLKELLDKNDEIIAECQNLQKLNNKLSEENEELRNRLQVPCSKCSQNRSVECGVQQRSAESYPLPKGLDRHSAAALNSQPLTALWKILIAYLLYQTCSMSSTKTLISNHWSNSHKASYKISPQTWKLLLKRQIAKNHMLVDKQTLQRWWGRHQKSWNPVGAEA